MMNIFTRNVNKIFTHKILLLLALILSYSFLLTFFPNSEFSGLFNIEDKISGKKPELTTLDWSELFFERFYFVLVTTTAVGYGDVIPKSRRLKLINSVYLLIIIYIMFGM
jgi:hypothetical protein